MKYSFKDISTTKLKKTRILINRKSIDEELFRKIIHKYLCNCGYKHCHCKYGYFHYIIPSNRNLKYFSINTIGETENLFEIFRKEYYEKLKFKEFEGEKMADIKLIGKDTDFSKLELKKIGWDSWYNKTPLDVYQIPSYIHSIGGRWGENNYWCCKRGEKPSFETLMEFNGFPCQWSYSINEHNYYRYKWEQKSIERNYVIKLFRNNDVFYKFCANNIDWAISRVRLLLFEINEHPIEFHMVDYQKQIIGREILWNHIPCIIKDYSINYNLMIVPDLRYTTYEDFFKVIINCDEEDRHNKFIMEDLFSTSILWFNLSKGDSTNNGKSK